MNQSYWGMIERPDPSNGRVIMHRSPVYLSEHELHLWKRATFLDGDELILHRREVTGASFRDVPLTAHEDTYPDPERLAAILAPARAALDAATSVRPVKGRAERSRIALEARARMDAAAEAVAACSGGGETPEPALPAPPVRADLL